MSRVKSSTMTVRTPTKQRTQFETDEVRVEGRAKVSGEAAYSADAVRPGMLWAAFVASPYAHARIVSVGMEAARKMPGVHAVLAGADIGEHYLGRALFDWPVLAIDVVHFNGQYVVAVAAETREEAQAAARAVDVRIRRAAGDLRPRGGDRSGRSAAPSAPRALSVHHARQTPAGTAPQHAGLPQRNARRRRGRVRERAARLRVPFVDAAVFRRGDRTARDNGLDRRARDRARHFDQQVAVRAAPADVDRYRRAGRIDRGRAGAHRRRFRRQGPLGRRVRVLFSRPRDQTPDRKRCARISTTCARPTSAMRRRCPSRPR